MVISPKMQTNLHNCTLYKYIGTLGAMVSPSYIASGVWPLQLAVILQFSCNIQAIDLKFGESL